jgi:hypothetical protein
MNELVAWLAVAALASACCSTGSTSPASPSPTTTAAPPTTSGSAMSAPSASAELGRQIAARDFGLLFYWPQHEMTVNKIWTQAGGPALDALIEDRDAPLLARLVAAEVMFQNDFSFVERHDEKLIAQLYARALRERATPNANVWGLLWIDDGVGELGGRFIILERAAVPALRELLADETVVDWYEGSEEATLGNRARYRIKDFAAYYLSRIINHPLPFQQDFAARDAEIATLTAALPVDGPSTGHEGFIDRQLPTPE